MLRRHEVIQSIETVGCHVCGRVGHYYKGHNTSPLGVPQGLCKKHLPVWVTVREVVPLVRLVQGVGHATADTLFKSATLADGSKTLCHPLTKY